MNYLKTISLTTCMALIMAGCNNDDNGDTDTPMPVDLNAGSLSGGPFTFTVDGTPDMVSGITLDDSDLTGANQTYVVTDETNKILGLPGTLAALEGVDFDGAGAGICLIWHLTYEDGLTNLEVDKNTSELSGEFDLSNSITVTREALNAGMISGGPFTFTVDGTPDMVSGITLNDTDLTGANQTYVITDADNKILGLPATLTDVEGVDFDGAGAGVCFIWHMTYGNSLTGLEADTNIADLSDGTFALSNSITVTRNAPTSLNAGSLSGGPFTFTVDGNPDMVSGITLDDSELTGANQTYVITDADNKILGLPATLADVEGVDFDGAGAGVCLIWHLTYEDGLTNLEVDKNVSEFVGTFALSNSITVTRNASTSLNAGTLSGGPFTFTVDGTPDMVSGIALDDSELTGANQTYVITDADNKILGLPATLTDVEGVDFDGAGAGVCLIWHLTYEDGLTNLEVDKNVSEFEGTFALSNSITVTRNAAAVLNAGTLSGGPFVFDVDGTPDMVSGIALDDSELTGANQTYVITDEDNKILGLPATLADVEGVNFDGAGPGICFIWHLTYEDGLTNLEVDKNVSDLEGDFALSNFVRVTRTVSVVAGVLSGGPFNFTIDGTPDMVSGITLDDSALTGSVQTYVVTDADDNILGIPPTLADLEAVDFNNAGNGDCFIWHLTYNDGLTGLRLGRKVTDLVGSFALSNSIQVTRTSASALNAGKLSGDSFSFTVDGRADNVSRITLDATGLTGDVQTYLITDDNNMILGVPADLAAVEAINFDDAGAGVCLIWHLTYNNGLTNLMQGNNIADFMGTYALSNAITVTRRDALNAGVISGGPFDFTVDGTPDMVSGISLDATGLEGDNQQWVITDNNKGKILGLFDTLEELLAVDFDASGTGVCLIYHITYEDGIKGLKLDKRISKLRGFFGLSNAITVNRN